MKTRTKDVLERLAATAVEAGAGAAAVYLGDLNPAWAPLIAIGLAAIKSWAAKWIGDKDSASVAPGV